MKKITALVLTIIMIFALCACGEKKEAPESEMAWLANPMTEYESLEALNEEFGYNMVRPGVMGLEDIYIGNIAGSEGNVAQYKFSVNGHEYTYRASALLSDISGVYVDGGTIFSKYNDGEEAFVTTADYYAARWYTIDCQYCVTTEAKDLTEEQFSACVDELKSLAIPRSIASLPNVADLEGTYADEFSQRAMLETADLGDGSLIVSVHWGSSASEFDSWEMHAKFTEDGLLSYNDCMHERVTLGEEGEFEDSEILAENQEGYFVYNAEEKSLSWLGAADEDCRDCKFVMMDAE